MTAITIINQRRARALDRAFELVAGEAGLDPLNEPLRLARNEPFVDEPYALAELTAALAGICHQQRRHIAELAERIEELEGRLGPPPKAEGEAKK